MIAGTQSVRVVKLNEQTGTVARVLKNACGGLPVRLGKRADESEVCGKPGRRLVAGVWLCVAHYGAFMAEVSRLACELAAGEGERVAPRDVCMFPAREKLVGPLPLCEEPATEQIGAARVCRQHFGEAIEWVRARDEAAQAACIEERSLRREAEMETWAAVGSQVIYYLRRSSDGAIKIGTSTELFRRHRSLAREHGELQLLLTHCGAYPRERELHQRFAALRLDGEWFRSDLQLLEWIMSVRRKRANARELAPGTLPLAEVRVIATAIAA